VNYNNCIYIIAWSPSKANLQLEPFERGLLDDTRFAWVSKQVIVVPLDARGWDQAEMHGGATDACRPEAEVGAYLFGNLRLPTPSVSYISSS